MAEPQVASSSDQTFQPWTTMDIVVVAVIAVVFGVINTGFGVIYQMGIAAFGPWFTAFFMVFNISQVVAMYIIRKPGVGLVNGTINGVVQFLSGNPGGVATLFWGFLQGAGVELPFLFTGYRRYTPALFFIGAGLATDLAKIVNVILYGWGKLGPATLVSIWVVAFFFSGALSGLGGYGIGVMLKRTGLIKSFRGGVA